MISPRAFLLGLILALGAGTLLGLSLAPPAAAPAATGTAGGEPDGAYAPVRWRIPVAFGTNLPSLGDNILRVEAMLEGGSGGRFELQVFEPGAIVPAFSITEAVRDAKVPAGYTWLGYDQGRIPAAPLFSAVPFGLEPWEFMAWWYEGGGAQLAREVYAPHGIHPLLCGLIGPETAGWFRRPIETLADVGGLKIRFAGLGGRVLERLGASVTMIPGGEIFQALEKGAIDATEYSLPVVDRKLGFDRVARFNYFPGWHQTFTAAHLVVNADTWANLAPVARAQLETACTAGVARNLASAEYQQGPVIAGFAAEGVSATRLPDPLLAQLARTSVEVLASEAARDPLFARVWASQQQFRADYAHWKRLAYLPRDFELPPAPTGSSSR